MNTKTLKLIDDCLKFSVSKDETRLNMNGIYYDPKLKNAVSTNGYIMTYSKSKYVEEFSDKIIDFKNMSVIKREFLAYQSVIPKTFLNHDTVSIGSHHTLSQRYTKVKAYFIFNKGFVLSETVIDDHEFVIDPKFLKPLVGHTLVVSYIDNLKPIRFTLVENDSYFIIMPMKV